LHAALTSTSADGIRVAIEAPAKANDYEFEPSLIAQILRDAGATEDRSPELGTLPLLQHALYET